MFAEENPTQNPEDQAKAGELAEKPASGENDSETPDIQPEKTPESQPPVDVAQFLAQQKEQLQSLDEVDKLIEARRDAMSRIEQLKIERRNRIKDVEAEISHPVEGLSLNESLSNRALKNLVAMGIFETLEAAKKFRDNIQALNDRILLLKDRMKQGGMAHAMLKGQLDETVSLRKQVVDPVEEKLKGIQTEVKTARNIARKKVIADYEELLNGEKIKIGEINSDPRVNEYDALIADQEKSELLKEVETAVNFVNSKHGEVFGKLGAGLDRSNVRDAISAIFEEKDEQKLRLRLFNCRADIVSSIKSGKFKNTRDIVPWRGPKGDLYQKHINYLSALSEELLALLDETMQQKIKQFLADNQMLRRLYGKATKDNPFWNAWPKSDENNGHQKGGQKQNKKKRSGNRKK